MAKSKSAAAEVSVIRPEAEAISRDMRKLYADFSAGSVPRETADTLANIAGKNLKALSLILADQIRMGGQLKMIGMIGSDTQEK